MDKPVLQSHNSQIAVTMWSSANYSEKNKCSYIVEKVNWMLLPVKFCGP